MDEKNRGHFTTFSVCIPLQGPVSRKSRELFGPEKPFVKLRPPYSVKLVFSYVVEGIKINITAKFRASRRLHFEDTKRIMSPDLRPKSSRDFRETGPRGPFLESPEAFSGPKSHSQNCNPPIL